MLIQEKVARNIQIWMKIKRLMIIKSDTSVGPNVCTQTKFNNLPFTKNNVANSLIIWPFLFLVKHTSEKEYDRRVEPFRNLPLDRDGEAVYRNWKMFGMVFYVAVMSQGLEKAFSGGHSNRHQHHPYLEIILHSYKQIKFTVLMLLAMVYADLTCAI